MKKIPDDAFVLVDNKVMMTQAAVADLFNVSTARISELTEQLEDAHLDNVARYGDQYYYSTPEVIVALQNLNNFHPIDLPISGLFDAFDAADARLIRHVANDRWHEEIKPPRNTSSFNLRDIISLKYLKFIVFTVYVIVGLTSGKNPINGLEDVLKYSAVLSIVFLILIKFPRFMTGFLAFSILLQLTSTPESTSQPVKSSSTSATPSSNETTSTPSTPDDTSAQTTTLKLIGRGLDNSSSLSYVGVNGYISVGGYDISGDYNQLPWQVATYTRDKQFWNKTDQTLDHKTPVIVRDQFLEAPQKRGYSYTGYLLVERLSDGKHFYIDVKNFIINPYWNSDDVASVLKEKGSSFVIVKYHQRSDYWPVTGDNSRKAELPDGVNLLATGIDRINDVIYVRVPGINKVYSAKIHKEDLTIVY